MQPGLHEALGAALQVLHDLGLRYALVGGLAVSAWAVPRATRDADLWVDLEGHENDLVVELQSAVISLLGHGPHRINHACDPTTPLQRHRRAAASATLPKCGLFHDLVRQEVPEHARPECSVARLQCRRRW